MVENLVVKADETGKPKAEISFRCPTQTTDEKALTGTLTAEIKRGDDVICTKEGLEPGATFTFTDEVGTHGKQNYSVRVYADGVPGMEALISVFIGNSAPLSPGEVIAVENPDNYGNVTISWTAPTQDDRGRTILPENLTYEIQYAWDDGQTGVLVSDLKETSYTYTPKQPSENEQFVTYMVSASTPYGANNVGSRTREQIPVGKAFMAPWSESFNGALTAPMGRTLINGTPGCGWDVYNDSDGVVAQDEDNCFAAFGGRAEGNAGSLYTGKLDLSEVEQPMLTYYVYKMGPEDINTLEVSAGGFGTWESLDLVSMDQLEEGWNKIELPMDDYAGKTIQLKWIATVKLYSYVIMDNLSLKGVVSSPALSADKEPIESHFFTLDGIEVKAPVSGGCYIMVTKYSDGTTSTRKLMGTNDNFLTLYDAEREYALTAAKVLLCVFPLALLSNFRFRGIFRNAVKFSSL